MLIPRIEELDGALAELLETVSFDVELALDAGGRPIGSTRTTRTTDGG